MKIDSEKLLKLIHEDVMAITCGKCDETEIAVGESALTVITVKVYGKQLTDLRPSDTLECIEMLHRDDKGE